MPDHDLPASGVHDARCALLCKAPNGCAVDHVCAVCADHNGINDPNLHHALGKLGYFSTKEDSDVRGRFIWNETERHGPFVAAEAWAFVNDKLATLRPWTMSRAAWKHVRGFPSPHIAEISPMQYAHLSKRAKRAYDEKRHAEWDESAAGGEAYAAAIREAHERAAFSIDDPDVNRDAREIIMSDQVADNKERAKRAEEAKRKAMELDPSELVYGLRCKHPIYGEGTITRVNRVSVVFTTATGMIKTTKDFYSRLEP